MQEAFRFRCCPCCSGKLNLKYVNLNPSPIVNWQEFFYGDVRYIPDLVACTCCGFSFINTLVSDAGDFYEAQDVCLYKQVNRFRRRYFQAIKEKVEKLPSFHLPPGGKILDVGCADGEWLSLWSPTQMLCGIETCSAYFDELERRNIQHQDTVAETGTFAMISMFDYLEHCIDPYGELSGYATKLAKGGMVIIGVPDMGKWAARILGVKYYLYCPMHFSYFNQYSLQALLKRVFPHGQTVILPSPPMRCEVNSLLKWLRSDFRLPEKYNFSLPLGYSASLIAVTFC